jgi:hypothetical protein
MIEFEREPKKTKVAKEAKGAKDAVEVQGFPGFPGFLVSPFFLFDFLGFLGLSVLTSQCLSSGNLIGSTLELSCSSPAPLLESLALKAGGWNP